MALTDNVGIPSDLGIFKITDVGGTLRNFRCKAQEIKRDFKGKTTEEETYCGIAKTKGAGSVGYSGKFLYDGSADSVDRILYPLEGDLTPRLYEWYPGGDAVGQLKYSGSGYLTSRGTAAPAGKSVLVDIVYDSVSEVQSVI